ncbi:hypothetical protein AKJ50_01755 [candidate division MSBL1 archaeon SCGC-AAA382A13]|uniref:AAA domain-containing protein n=1 Tax=candidate division MSBL1 archaeon SCGC-AAA382A13 TaxID=1698279 RepID=A0A133VF99_9EURY|nr:hypothetical protein AKJ50_01755 [candidate division MSBL1 archaeon SCGC-AAA382A13]
MTIISVASGKGGVGKTTIVSNLGLAMGKNGKKALLVDADLPSGNLGYYLGHENLTPSLTDFLAGEVDSIQDVIKNVSKNVDLLPSPPTIRKFLSADISKIKTLLPDLSTEYDVTLIDCPPGISRNSITPIEASEQILLVVTPDEASVSSAENMAKIGRLIEKGMKGYILNRWKERSFFARLFGEETQIKPELIESRMGINHLGTVNEDEKVRESTEIGEPLLKYESNSDAANSIREISKKI